jgi:predicted RNase H-like nuclease (RuvC/YqgF family)
LEAPAVVAAEKKMQELQRKYDRLRDRNTELEQLVDAYAAVIEELTHQRDALTRFRE